MHPVLGGLTDKVLLRTASCRITADGVSLGTNQVIELGELYHKSIVIVLEEGLRIETRCKNWFEMPPRFFLQGGKNCTSA